MAGSIPLAKICETIAPNLISTRSWGDASFISLPIVYPSGSFVTVRLTYAPGGIRVSDSGFAYREIETFGATRAFANTARGVCEKYGVEAGKRAVFVEVPVEEVERAIFDVSAASKAIAERIIHTCVKGINPKDYQVARSEREQELHKAHNSFLAPSERKPRSGEAPG